MRANLYFIAIIPNRIIRERIVAIKLDLKKKYSIKHALKSPAHITLQMPFKKNPKEEYELIEHLNEFVIGKKSFEVELNGYSHFSTKVLFIKIENHSKLINLQTDLKKILLAKMNFSNQDVNKKFHPHLTLATRDLNIESFSKIWPQFKNKNIKYKFLVNSIYLLKHNGKYWDIFKKFTFSTD